MNNTQPHPSRKTVYHLLRLESLDSKNGVESWQIEDHRLWTLEQLFASFEPVHWHLNRVSFCAYAKSVQTPEELLDLFIGESKMQGDQEYKLYLVVFEIWRRLIPHHASFEMLCDEIDYQIHAYELGQQVDQKIDAFLGRCLTLIHDQGAKTDEAREIFNSIDAYCAHHLEGFLYDYISDQIEAGALKYAQELYTNFVDLVQEPLWFSLLKVRLSDNREASLILGKMYSKLGRVEHLDIVLETLNYLSEHDVSEHFYLFFDLASKMPLDSEQRAELAELAQSYLENCDHRCKLRQGLIEILQNKNFTQ